MQQQLNKGRVHVIQVKRIYSLSMETSFPRGENQFLTGGGHLGRKKIGKDFAE